MKKIIGLIILVGLFCLLEESLYACTSFAVYSNQVIYGMNFDFANIPMKFFIAANGDIRTFHLAFERTLGEMKFFVNTAGMNSKGLFASCQELHPIDENPPAKTDENIFTFEVYDAMARNESFNEIKETCNTAQMVNIPNITLHNLIADAEGNAMVTEAGENKNNITVMDGRYMVMTNFPNCSMNNKSYTEAEGKGADRYKICHEYILDAGNNFTTGNGLELLELAYNRDPDYPTGCSMVFDPRNQEVFVALNRDFSHLWKVGLDAGTIEQHKGFNSEKEYDLNGDGVAVSELLLGSQET
ncbi:MAG: linear amide C-N hydrolase [bacterium]|nr:linear amide C-N hydrolase [bacterium]